jgi:hypothetical protein
MAPSPSTAVGVASLLVICGCAGPKPQQTPLGLRPAPEPFRCEIDSPEPPSTSSQIVVIVLDRSRSTVVASGIDVDGDGEVGRNPQVDPAAAGYAPDVQSTDPGDSILAAQLSAACAWIEQSVGAGASAGLVAFSGPLDPTTGLPRRGQPAAVRLSEVTDRRSKLAKRLEHLWEIGSTGGTDYAAGIDEAVAVIEDYRRAHPGSARWPATILFLTDGLPTLPVGTASSSDPGDHEAAREAAGRARAEDIRIHVLTFGSTPYTALPEDTPRTVAEMAKGEHRAVDDMSDLLGAMTELWSAP